MTRHEERIIKEWLKEMTEETDKTVHAAVSDFLEAYYTLENMWQEGKLANTGYAIPLVNIQEEVSKIEKVYDDSVGV